MRLLRLIGAGLFVSAGVIGAVGVTGALGGLDGGHWLTVTRACGVGDYGDESSHYFLELADGSGILALSGQYLYEYEPIDDDPELNQPRRFPCTSFTVRRHRTEQYAVDLICGGDIIEPELMASGLVIKAWFRDGFAPEDGTILTGVSFDELERSRRCILGS